MKEENLDMALFKLDAFIQEYKPSEKAIENRALLETPVMLGYFESKELLNYIENLQSQLKEKEEVIKEAREYIKEHIRIDDEYPAYMEMLITERDELDEILSKGENK